MARGSTGRGSGSGDASKDDPTDRRDSTSDSPKQSDSAKKSGSDAAESVQESAKVSAQDAKESPTSRTRAKPQAKGTAKGKSAVRQAAKTSAKAGSAKSESTSRPGSRSSGKSAKKAPASKSGGGGRPPRGKGRGAVGRRRVPWVLVLATVGVVIFAGVAIGYAVDQVGEAEAKEAAASASKDPTSIKGITEKGFPGGQHSTNAVSYGDTPPFGGAHDPEWADCTGTVYTEQIRTENVVHSLEHGAVWITYLPGIPKEEIDALAEKVEGKDFMVMSPYPDQQVPISLQSWGFQLQVQTADDPRVDKFINATRLNPEYTPEYGATCSNPAFKESPRLPGQPATTPGPTDAPVGTSPDDASATAPAPTG